MKSYEPYLRLGYSTSEDSEQMGRFSLEYVDSRAENRGKSSGLEIKCNFIVDDVSRVRFSLN